MGFDGRLEKRAPVALAVFLANLQEPRTTERTYTENVSPRGARVVTERPWLPDDQPVITPSTEEFQRPARVVYCQLLENGRFCVGLEFKGRAVKWDNGSPR
jgi:hypothetical protein